MFGNNNTPFNMPVVPAYGNGGGRGLGFGDDWLALIILLAIFGWGGNGGFGGYGGGQVGDNYVLASDMSQIERKLDGVNNGLCYGFYQEAQLINGVQMQLANDTANIMQGLNTQGYETRNAITQDTIANMQGFNGVQAAVKDCCCQTQQNIKDVNYNLAMMGNGIERNLEKGFCDTNYNMATQNCQTLQAIDKVGDRIIDYLANQETQKLRDQLAEYRDREGRQYVINELNKCPIPAYLTCNPNAPLNYNVTYGNGCGCA